VASGDPVALSQFEDCAPLQSAGRRQIEFLQAGREREGSRMQVTLNAVLASLGAFIIHEQRQAFFKSQLRELGCVFSRWFNCYHR
jgi:hypothetical protein